MGFDRPSINTYIGQTYLIVCFSVVTSKNSEWTQNDVTSPAISSPSRYNLCRAERLNTCSPPSPPAAAAAAATTAVQGHAEGRATHPDHGDTHSSASREYRRNSPLVN